MTSSARLTRRLLAAGLVAAITIPVSATSARYGVSCPAAGHCVAVGLDDWNPASNATLSGQAAAATWNGKTWRAAKVRVPGTGDASGFAGVASLPGSKTFCAAVGFVGPRNSRVSRTLSGFWNGTRWKVIFPAQ